jgi:DNA-binding CsgD family transcriptional regulator
MRDGSAVIEISEIATSTAPLLGRAQAVLETLSRSFPFDAAWLALSDPRSTMYATVGSIGLDRAVIDYLDRPSVAQEIELTGYNRNRPPVSVGELAVAADELPTWAECLIPAGFQDALGVALFEPGGPHIGVLSFLCSGREAPTAQRGWLAQLSPLVARAVSPVNSLIANARLVRGATAGAFLLRNGSTCPVPGLDGHPLLATDSLAVQIARNALKGGHLYRSFMWPCYPGATDHVRMTVLAASDLPGFMSGALLLTTDVDCHRLTARELEVLGLVVDGCSNQQIARRLAITPRTVAAHIERILHKLKTPSRTSAAVRADREGCFIPAQPPRSDRRR